MRPYALAAERLQTHVRKGLYAAAQKNSVSKINLLVGLLLEFQSPNPCVAQDRHWGYLPIIVWHVPQFGTPLGGRSERTQQNNIGHTDSRNPASTSYY